MPEILSPMLSISCPAPTNSIKRNCRFTVYRDDLQPMESSEGIALSQTSDNLNVECFAQAGAAAC